MLIGGISLQILEKKLPGVKAVYYNNPEKESKILILNNDLSNREKEKIIEEVKNESIDSWQLPDQLKIKECGKND